MSLLAEGEVIEGFYQAALGQLSWGDAGHLLTKRLGGLTLMLSTHAPQTSSVDVVSTLGMSSDHLQLYSERYAHQDLWALGALKRHLIGMAMQGSQAVEDHLLARSPIYNEFLRPKVNMHHLCGAIIRLDGGNYAVVGVHRPRDARAFEAPTVDQLSRLLPHLQRSLEIRQRLRNADAASQYALATFDKLRIGVVLLASNGYLLHVNEAGETILRRADGLLRVPQGLRALFPDDDKRLQHVIHGVRKQDFGSGSVTAAGGHVRIRRKEGNAAYTALVSPVTSSVGGSRSHAVLLLITNPDQFATSDMTPLRQIFGFPVSEARLVLALLSGVNLPNYASRARISYHTARTLLSRAMARTDTNSQLELVLLVSRSLAGVV